MCCWVLDQHKVAITSKAPDALGRKLKPWCLSDTAAIGRRYCDDYHAHPTQVANHVLTLDQMTTTL
jgi:uncharacterized protein CbrC (UPF0167 family)